MSKPKKIRNQRIFSLTLPFFVLIVSMITLFFMIAKKIEIDVETESLHVETNNSMEIYVNWIEGYRFEVIKISEQAFVLKYKLDGEIVSEYKITLIDSSQDVKSRYIHSSADANYIGKIENEGQGSISFKVDHLRGEELDFGLNFTDFGNTNMGLIFFLSYITHGVFVILLNVFINKKLWRSLKNVDQEQIRISWMEKSLYFIACWSVPIAGFIIYVLMGTEENDYRGIQKSRIAGYGLLSGFLLLAISFILII